MEGGGVQVLGGGERKGVESGREGVTCNWKTRMGKESGIQIVTL